MSEVKHTPLPWVIRHGMLWQDGLDGDLVVPDLAPANARLIVQAVNSHGDLVEALRRVEKALSEKKPVLAGIIAKSALSKVLELGEGL